jgi:ABC-type molybdenum transport system ATPase subunit/photorepair protein PhrA
VSDLSFTLAAGTITGFLGPNGAGKTTTLHVRQADHLPSICSRLPPAALCYSGGCWRWPDSR